MKKILAFALCFVLMTSCSDDDDPAIPDTGGLSTTPDAKIEYNDNNYGIYKGIFVGSSGIIKININNDNNVNAMMVVDGVTYNFTTEEVVVEGEAITELTFTSGLNSFAFNVGADGVNPNISYLSMEGHPFANTEVIKEYSDAQVRCYQGAYSGAEAGVFNFVTIENGLFGLSMANGATDTYYLSGSINGGSITGSFSDGAFQGAAVGNAVSGSWETSSGTGSWNAQRKL